MHIIESIETSFWGVVTVHGIFFGIADLLEHPGNRRGKPRGMEIFRKLMKHHSLALV